MGSWVEQFGFGHMGDLVKLDTIREMIATSVIQDWHLIHDGPTYIGWSTDPDLADGVGFDWHGDLAIFRDEVDLRLAWGLRTDPNGPAVRAAWLTRLGEPFAIPVFVDVLWHGALVDRLRVLSVGTGSAYLPESYTHHGRNGQAEQRVSAWSDALARLIHGFSGHGDYEDYFTRAGLV